MERRFSCTACGKCCYGSLPLTLDEALDHAGRFPLAMMWTPVPQASKAFSLTARLGATLNLGKRKQIAVRVAPVAYLPPALPCPALNAKGLCAIHADKPSRCRTMPFFPYREEADQTDLLIPRSGWLCDTSAEAPAVYRDKKIVERGDFDSERSALVNQAAILGPYADWLLESVPTLKEELVRVARKRTGGHVVVNFSTLLPPASTGRRGRLRAPAIPRNDRVRRQDRRCAGARRIPPALPRMRRRVGEPVATAAEDHGMTGAE